jgi:3-methylfumaryl-CoA hydratase
VSEWEGWVGRTTSARERLDAGQANHMAVTLGRDPVYGPGDALPPAWHWLYFHDLVKASDLGPEGHPRLGLVMPPIPLARRMWAGGTLVFRSPILLGEVVERRSTIKSITPKEGRTGPLCFVNVEHVLSSGDTVLLVEEQTIVYREMSSETRSRKPASLADDASFSREWNLNSTALFRYSALTFNGHRIHYDADYCRSVEGYPNLVIHGPLLATLLLDLCVEEGLSLGRFTYRAISPLFLPGPLSVSGKVEGSSVKLWAGSLESVLAMEAKLEPLEH